MTTIQQSTTTDALIHDDIAPIVPQRYALGTKTLIQPQKT